MRLRSSMPVLLLGLWSLLSLFPCWQKLGGWEMAFIVIGALGFVWMGLWVFMYTTPDKSKHVNKAELEYIEQDKNEKDVVVVEEEHEKKIGFCNVSRSNRLGPLLSVNS